MKILYQPVTDVRHTFYTYLRSGKKNKVGPEVSLARFNFGMTYLYRLKK